MAITSHDAPAESGQTIPPGDADAAVLQVEGLVKRYGEHTAVAGLSFEVRQGEIFGFLGPNGAGKSTTLEIIEGLRAPDGGTVRVFGRNLAEHLRVGKGRVGVQLQGTALPPRLTVDEVLDLFAALYGSTASPERLVARFRLGDFRRKTVRKLSGGQQQRLALALAFINDPDLVILDEPSVGLDPVARRDLWAAILAARDSGQTIVLATHDMVEAERLCDRVAIVDRGRVIALGSPRALAREYFTESAIRVATEQGTLPDEVAGLEAVTRVAALDHLTVVYSGNAPRSLAALLELGERRGLTFTSIEIRPATLEDVFLKLTGRGLN